MAFSYKIKILIKLWFQCLDEGSSYSSSFSNEWGDVLHEKFDSHSLHLIPNFHHENPLENFTHFNYGIRYMEKEENMEIIENQIRYFVEECNTFQVDLSIRQNSYN